MAMGSNSVPVASSISLARGIDNAPAHAEMLNLPEVTSKLRSYDMYGVQLEAVVRPGIILDTSTVTASRVSGSGGGYTYNGTGTSSMSISTTIESRHDAWMKMLDSGREVLLSSHGSFEKNWNTRQGQSLLSLWIRFPDISIRDWPVDWLDSAWKDLPRDITGGTSAPYECLSTWDCVAFAAHQHRDTDNSGWYEMIWQSEGICLSVDILDANLHYDFPASTKGMCANMRAPNLSVKANSTFHEVVSLAMQMNLHKNQGRQGFFATIRNGIALTKKINEMGFWINELQSWSKTALRVR